MPFTVMISGAAEKKAYLLDKKLPAEAYTGRVPGRSKVRMRQ